MNVSNKSATKIPWIKAGYEIFSLEGPKGLIVERLAREVQKSKSSFYHHFAEIELFIDQLLAYHLERAKVIRAAEKKCKQIIPDLIELVLCYKQDLLFNRQLRFNRNTPKFEQCYVAASENAVSSILKIWSDYLGLEEDARVTQLLLELSMENFYLHITEDNLNYEWMEAYLRGLKQRMKHSLRF